MQNKSALAYRRLKYTRAGGRPQGLPDVSETSFPRYERGITSSHRRGEKRISRWGQYA
jgi:hypothetical protein